jgi:hypothetical protein
VSRRAWQTAPGGAADTAGRGVAISEVVHDTGSVFRHHFASFADPDGNGWIVEQLVG